MRPVKIEVVDGNTIITTESKFLWWRWTRKFKGHPWVGGYYQWLELPNMTIVDDSLFFQLKKLFLGPM